MKFFHGALCFLVCFLLSSGCGYHLVGYGSALPSHIRTIAVPVFQNTSTEPNIHRDATDAIRQIFITDGRLKLVSTREADLLVRGILTDYQLRAVSFSGKDMAEEYIVRLGVQVEAYDRAKGKVLLSQKFTTQWDYRITSGVVASEAARFAAVKEAYDDLGDQLVNIIIERF